MMMMMVGVRAQMQIHFLIQTWVLIWTCHPTMMKLFMNLRGARTLVQMMGSMGALLTISHRQQQQWHRCRRCRCCRSLLLQPTPLLPTLVTPQGVVWVVR
jgi:hypothetical protein